MNSGLIIVMGTRQSLIDRLVEVGKSARASKKLHSAAREDRRLFSDIFVEFIDFQQCGRRGSAATSDTYKEVIDADFSHILLSGVSTSQGKSVSNTFRKLETSKSRLHAEIQLVLYYEQNNGLLRPRVRAASKSASYPCDLFPKLHGRYYIPRTRGRLYDTWK